MPRSNTPAILQPLSGIIGLFKALHAIGKTLHAIGKVLNVLFTVLLPVIFILRVFGTIFKGFDYIFKPLRILVFKKSQNKKTNKPIHLAQDLNKDTGKKGSENKKTERQVQHLYRDGSSARTVTAKQKSVE